MRRGLQALVLFFTIAQIAAPLLHAHFSDGSQGVSGVHIHVGTSATRVADRHGAASEIRDFEARILSAPEGFFRDEPLCVLDLPAVGGSECSIPSQEGAHPAVQFVPVLATAAQPFPKPLPLAPPVPV
jgi:hypothetical protein